MADPWRIGLIAAGIGVGLVALTRRRRREPRPLRVQALDVSLAEDQRWAGERPSVERVDEYLIGVEPHGASLAAMNTVTNTVNFCAAAVGWSEHQTGLVDLPPWRSAAKQIMRDAQNGLRGPWHPISEVRDGWRPPVGALAVYHRGDPDSPFGHVDRVLSVREDGYDAIGANEEGRAWDIDFTPWTSPALLGFVVDGEEPTTALPEAQLRIFQEPALLTVVEPPLTPEERDFIRGRV